MREWTQDNKLIQQGTHFPLCIKLGKIATRSKAKQLERTPGTDQYKAKQEAKYPQGRPAYRSQQNQPPGGYATPNKNRYGHVRPQPMTPSPAAQAAVSTKIMCNECGGYDCTGPAQSSCMTRGQMNPQRPPVRHNHPHKRRTTYSL